MRRPGTIRAVCAVVLLAILAFVALTLRPIDEGEPGASSPAPPQSVGAGTDRDASAAETSAATRSHARAARPGSDGTCNDADGSTLRGDVIVFGGEETVPRAEIRISRITEAGLDAWGFVTTAPPTPDVVVAADDAGAFEAHLADAGPWAIEAMAPGLRGRVVVARAPGRVQLVLSPVRDIRVTIRANPFGETIAAAEVLLIGDAPDAPPRARITSDEHGNARIPVTDRDAIVVLARGFAPERRNVPRDGDDIWLDRGDRIAGVVRDARGGPVAGAEIRTGQGVAARAWTSGPDGDFALEGIESPAGDGVWFRVHAEGFPEWQGTLDPGDVEAVIVLVKPGTVSGVVLQPDGSPAAFALITTQSGAGTADKSGHFAMTGVGPGPYAMHAVWEAPDRRGADALIGRATGEMPDGGTVDDVEIHLAPRPVSYVSVRVVDSDDNPVPDAQVEISQATVVDARDGTTAFTFAAPPGTTVRAGLTKGPGAMPRVLRETTLVTTSAAPGGPVAEIRIRPLRRVTVEVRSPDTPLPDVEPLRALRNRASEKTLVGLAERWWFASIEPIAVTATSVTWDADPFHGLVVGAVAPGYAEVRRAVTDAEIESGRVVLTLERGATVRGRVVGGDALSASNAVVSLDRIADEASAQYLKPAVRTQDGAFRFDGVPAGQWRLRVTYPADLVVAERELQVDGGTMDLGDVRVASPARLRGSVVYPDGRPAGGASVRFESDEDANLGNSSSHAAPDGSFELIVSPFARGGVRASKSGWGTVAVPLDRPSAAPIRLTLAPEGRLDVRIRLPRVVGSAWGWRVRTPDGAAAWQPEEFVGVDAGTEGLPGVDRRLLWRGLAPGPIVVLAEGADWKLERTVTVVAGATTVVELGEPR